jgi:structure-specific recognition protein 1
MAKVTQFDDIHLNLGDKAGKLRLAESGLGWKAPSSTQPFTLPTSDIKQASWVKASRGYMLKINTRQGDAVTLDNFREEDLEALASAIQEKFSLELLRKEHALKGWNWGKTNITGSDLGFQVNGKNAFDLPLKHIVNTNLTGKAEVSIEFGLPGEADESNKDARREAMLVDQMVEIRFYVPGQADVKNEDAGSDKEDGAEEVTNAQIFYDTLKDRADVGESAGDAIASFSDVVCIVPRGRYEIDMFASSLRLRGKTYDYKVQYSAIVNLFLLPKNDEANVLFVVGLDPPLRQGQTRYPFLCLQFAREEEMEVELNLDDAEYEEKYKDKLKKAYDQPTHQVVSQIFKGLSGRRVTVPSSYKSYHGLACVKCNHRANEGALYLLDKCVLFVTKPTIFVPFSDVRSVVLSRVGGSMNTAKTFDITFTSRTGQADQQFTSINREEQSALEEFLTSKGLRIKNDLQDDSAALLSAALAEEADMDDEDVPAIRGDSGGEDEESPDEDFEMDSNESDIAEEFDSDVQQDSGDDEQDAEAKPQKKKRKTED